MLSWRMPMIFLNAPQKILPSLHWLLPAPFRWVSSQLLGPGNLVLSTFIRRRGPSLKQATWFFSFYLFSFQDIDDTALSNVQFSEMDGTSLTGNSGKSDPACLHEHVLEQPVRFQLLCPLPSTEGKSHQWADRSVINSPPIWQARKQDDKGSDLCFICH